MYLQVDENLKLTVCKARGQNVWYCRLDQVIVPGTVRPTKREALKAGREAKSVDGKGARV